MSHDDIPSVKEELERKTVDLLTNLVFGTEMHRLTQDDLHMVAHALWNVTSGLVDQDVSDLCAAATNGTKPRKLTRNFVGKGSVITVMWLADSAGYLIVTRNATTLEKVVKTSKSEIGIREVEMTRLFIALVKSGYVEL